jgi:hypothetical protein
VERWLAPDTGGLALALALMAAVILFSIRAALRGRRRELRPLPAVEAIAELIGRATELGRPVYYVPGVRDLDEVQTLASLTILGTVGELAARHQCDLRVPASHSLVMNSARHVLREAYTAAGRPDAYHDGMVFYVSDDQYGYAARVDGLMARERPAACLLLGAFYGESLLLAEAGNRAGAVQVAGTAEVHQLPFLVAACEHVLIGEEFFAATAYLSPDPVRRGSLVGQDLVKYAVMAVLGIGALLGLVAGAAGGGPAAAALGALLDLLATRGG